RALAPLELDADPVRTVALVLLAPARAVRLGGGRVDGGIELRELPARSLAELRRAPLGALAVRAHGCDQRFGLRELALHQLQLLALLGERALQALAVRQGTPDGRLDLGDLPLGAHADLGGLVLGAL